MTSQSQAADIGRTHDPAPSLDFEDPLFRADPWPRYDWYRRNRPVHWAEGLGGYCVVGHENVRRVLTSTEFTAYHPFRTSRRAFGPSMLDSEGAKHRAARQCVAQSLRPKTVAELAETIVRPIAAELIDGALAERDTLMADRLAAQLPMRVVCRIMGLPEADAPWLRETMRPLVKYVDHADVPLSEVVERQAELRAYLQGTMARGEGDHALLGSLCANPELDDRDVVNNAVLLLAAGTETTAGAVTALLARIAQESDRFDELTSDRDTIAAVVAETLRHEPPLHFTLRFAAQDVRIGGVDIQRGAPIQACLASGSRDPDVYEDPHLWDHRRPRRTPLSFGVGPHICLGMGLAQAELEVLLSVLRDRCEQVQAVAPVPQVSGRAFRAAAGLRLECRPRAKQESSHG